MEAKKAALRRAPGLLERDLGDALVVMTDRGEALHTLRGTGLFLWKKIDGSCTLDDLISALTQEYEVDAPRAQADTQAFVSSLAALGLVIEA